MFHKDVCQTCIANKMVLEEIAQNSYKILIPFTQRTMCSEQGDAGPQRETQGIICPNISNCSLILGYKDTSNMSYD